MDKDLHQIAKAPMIALIEKKNIVENKMKRAAALLLMLGLIMPLAVQAQDFGNPSRAIDECRKPTELTVSQITTNSAQLSWIENGEATAWQICVNDDEENLVDADTNPYALTVLNPVTEYTVKVRANCGSEQSAWSTGLTFTTPCGAFALPYSYGFEDAGDLDCWEVIATSSLTGIATVDDAPEGSKVFRFFCAEQNAYLASPVFSGTEQGLDVAFQYMNRNIWSPYTEQFQVGYTTDEGAAPADFIYGETIYGENQWVTYENTFPPNTKRIAIKYIYLGYDSDPRYLRLDDFNFEPASSSCIRPFNLTAGTPGPHSVELSWTENGTATTWQIGYQAVGGTEQYVEVTENPYTLTGLNPGTDYKVRVQAKCGDGEYSPFTSFVSFTTRCEAFDLPYSYGFEDASELDCWEVIATYYPSFTGIDNANDAPEGSKVFRFYYLEQNAYLASPVFSGTEQGLDVAFQYMNYRTTTPYTEQFQVGYTTDENAAPADFTYGETIHGENHWVTYENTFPANTKRIAIKYIYTDGELLRLDDFNFEAVSSSCPRPFNLTAGPGPHKVVLGWTETGEATAWQICVNDDEENLIDADTNPYTLTGLTPVTEYTVKVRANCGAEQSAWSTGLTFTTRCEAFALPYSYGFEDAGDLDCWEVIATSSYTGIATVSDAPEGSKVFRFYHTEQNAYLASPVFSGTEQGLDVAFQYMNYSTTTSHTEQFQVGYTTDESAAPADFTYGDTIHGENHWVTYENSFPANTKRIAIRYIHANGYSLRLDDFNFEPAPSCPRPINLTAGIPEPHSVELGWTERGEATAWQICVNDDEENLIDADTNPYTLTGLTPGTEYTVKVRANCGAEQSAWSIGLTFTTPCEAFALPYSYGFEDAGDLECWEVIYTSSYTGIATANDAPEGSKVFYFDGIEQIAYLASPVFSGTEQGLDVAFQYMNAFTGTPYTAQFQVGYTTDAGAAPADFTYGNTIHGENHWVTYENTFPANTKRIAIKYIYTDGLGLRLDDFNFEAVSSSCIRPRELAAGTPGSRSVELIWTENGTATTWQIGYQAVGETEQYAEVTENPYTLTGLTPGTDYKVRVQAKCGDGEYSPFTSFVSFTTLCEAFVALPYSYGFENAGNLNCWEVIATSSNTGIATANDAPEGSKVFRFNYTERNAYLASPVFSGTEQGLDVAFQYMKGAYIPFTAQFQVGYTTDESAAPADFTYGDTIHGENQWVWYENTFPANTKRIAIKYIYTEGLDLRLDDFNFGSASCPRPRDLAADNITATTADLSWTENGTATTWQIGYQAVGGTEQYVEVTENPYTLTGLTPGTVYKVRVQAKCGDGEYSPFTSFVSFTTPCEAFALPYSYGFEDAGDLDCWEVIATSSNTGIATVGDAPEGENVFRFHYHEPNAYLASPVFSGTEQGLDVAFQYMNSSTTTSRTEQFQVGYTTDAGAAPADFTYGETIYGENHWVRYENAFPPNTKRIAIKYIHANGLYLRLDDFNFEATSSSCPRPFNLTADTPGLHSVELGWTERGEATAWQICLNDDEENLIDADTNPYTLTGLNPRTEYTVKVRANCGSEQSAWSNAIDFTTLCGYDITFEMPYTQGFENPEGTLWTQHGLLPPCWEGYNNPSYPTPHNTIGSYGAPHIIHSGEQCLSFCNEDGDSYAILPEFSNPISDLQINFWMATNGNTTDKLRLGYITTEDDGTCNTFTEIASYDSNFGSMVQRSKILENVPAEAYRLTFKWSTSYYYLCFIDDVEVSINPAVTFPPRDIAAANITNHTADITWEGACDSYALRYREVPTLFKEGFEGGTMPEGWSIVGENQDPTKTWRVGVGDFQTNTGTHSGNYNALITHNFRNQVTYLVMPALDLSSYDGVELSFWYINKRWGNDTDEFAVCYRIGNEGGWNELWSTTENHEAWTSQSVELTGLANNYQIGFRFTDHYGYGLGLDDIALCEMPLSGWITVSEAESPHTLTGLTIETTYEVQVKSNCAGYEDWSESIGFTTMECEIPADMAVSDLTATSAALAWTGFSDSYNVRYRTAAHGGFSEDFESGTSFANWTFISMNTANAIGTSNGAGRLAEAAHSGSYGFRFSSYSRKSDGETYDQYLVSPELTVTGELSFYFKKTNASAETLYFGYSTTTNDLEAFTWTEDLAPTQSWQQYTQDLPADVKYVAFHYFGNYLYYVYVDDIVIGNPIPAGEWESVEGISSLGTTLGGLQPATPYEWQVQGVCDGEATEWSEIAYFTTEEGITLTKDIVGYGNSAGGWYLIASPVVETVTPTAENGFLTNEYDLYFFDQSQILEEWQNWKLNNFNLVSGKGYLYASQESTTLVFSGTPHPATDPVEVPLDYDGSVPDFAGWNLVGNPFAEPAFVDFDFYTMNSGGTEIIASTSTTVEAMEGIFVVAEGENESVTFTRADAGAKGANLALNISNGRAVIDRAIVRFDSHRSLLKFQLDPNSTKVYIPQDGKDYAVVNAGRDAARHVSTMDVNFKAAKNGTYTLTFDTENVEFDYLHLIDNMTGADVDLLVVEPVETPTQGNGPSTLRPCSGTTSSGTLVSYTFTAKTTDYASRFKLVFAANNDGEGPSTSSGTFAYINNGQIIITAEVDDAMLQVVDMMGRIIRSEELSQCGSRITTAGMPAGVYVLRLIDGDETKAQKIVINK